GSSDWMPLRVEPRANGAHSWRPSTNGRMEARLRVRDRAGNEAEQKATVEPPAQDARSTDPRNSAAPEPLRGNSGSAPLAGNVPVRLVNSTHIELNYKLKD